MTTKVGRLATLAVAIVMTLGLFAAPASAHHTPQHAVGQAGLVNVAVVTGDITFEQLVQIQDVLRNVDINVQDVITVGDITITIEDGLIVVRDVLQDVQIGVLAIVQAPIGIAANVCPTVNAAVLAQAAQGATIDCAAMADSAADARQFQNWQNRGGGGR